MPENKRKASLLWGSWRAFALICGILSFSLILSFLSSALTLGKEELYLAVTNQGSKIVIIDPGHGGEDVGAIGVNGKYEKDLNLEISNILGAYLKNAGYIVVYTRTEDKLLYTEEENIKGFRKINDLKNRVKIASSYDDAIFVSIHMNSFSSPEYSGLQVYYSECVSGSEVLAQSIQDTVRSTLQKENNRRIKEGRDIYILENAVIPSVLVECGFITNKDECEKLSEKEYQKELSFAILCGIIDYIEK